MKRTVIFYTVGTLPHYLPLYLAAEELAKDTSSLVIEWKEIVGGTESLPLFARAARGSQEADGTLHVVLSGQLESSFDKDVFATALVDQFVAASVFIHRVPLWLLCEKGHEATLRTALLGSGLMKPPTAFVPKEGTTLYEEFIREFGNERFRVYQLDQALAVHDEASVLSLKGERKPDGPWVFASLFPIDTSELVILNDRLPTKSVGFTTLWLWKEAVYDEELMSVFRALGDKLHLLILELYDLDTNILTSRNSALLAGLSESCKIWLDIYEATAKSSAFKSISLQPWWRSRHRFLAHFLLDRIWDTDFNFVRSAPADPAEQQFEDGDVIYRRSLAASYRSANIGAIRNAFAKSLETVSGKLDVLKEITETVAQLSQRLHLDAVPLVLFDRTLYEIQEFLRVVFVRTGWHSVGDYYDLAGNLKESVGAGFVQAARTLKGEGNGMPSVEYGEVPGDRVNASRTGRNPVKWITTLFESIATVEKEWDRKKPDCQMTALLVDRIHEVIKIVARSVAGQPSDVEDIQAALSNNLLGDTRSLLLCELKALSQRYIPISWLLCLDSDNSLASICDDLSFGHQEVGGNSVRRPCFYGIGGESVSAPGGRIHHIERSMVTFLDLLASCGTKRTNNVSGAKGGAIQVAFHRELFESGDGFLQVDMLYVPDRPGSPNSFAKLAAIAYGLAKEEGVRYGQDSIKLLRLRDFGLRMSVMHRQSNETQASIVLTFNNKLARELDVT
jgi:hypothetical protein